MRGNVLSLEKYRENLKFKFTSQEIKDLSMYIHREMTNSPNDFKKCDFLMGILFKIGDSARRSADLNIRELELNKKEIKAILEIIDGRLHDLLYNCPKKCYEDDFIEYIQQNRKIKGKVISNRKINIVKIYLRLLKQLNRLNL